MSDYVQKQAKKEQKEARKKAKKDNFNNQLTNNKNKFLRYFSLSKNDSADIIKRYSLMFLGLLCIILFIIAINNLTHHTSFDVSLFFVIIFILYCLVMLTYFVLKWIYKIRKKRTSLQSNLKDYNDDFTSPYKSSTISPFENKDTILNTDVINKNAFATLQDIK